MVKSKARQWLDITEREADSSQTQIAGALLSIAESLAEITEMMRRKEVRDGY